ncbi:protein-ADP-ribose hydrolase [Staphylococcus lugdunensis]|uniref:protein-ADP-ribose hydrolase n=1 Tax=Staphylococcus lugdunensis TaxID=28035 RepID=UPI000A115775|nr:protein-ADP-ribose hydrolase [Staphylococcus lugdunensis]ARJ26335.1 hypothetical protein B7469_01125 [Staphylococcus lugdunensis]MCH8646683.1 protein-ADP-ribose hydrolase [Staphylococcus lugdunensis]MCH8673439.1 protein-ADP-ribose hydrolase [Staphylococcus lugdunensis]MCH8675988.1 protein-ADP-ribose hydrolase [Staphylococcus lugdunensis]MCI2752187.1 protein-ADP-ribose hydrolase [Staphylococcus lugdunensis]
MLQTQSKRLAYLTHYLWQEAHGSEPLNYPTDSTAQWELYRGLANVRPPEPISQEYLDIQDAYLSALSTERQPIHMDALTPVENQQLYVWQGDITRLAVDGIVNAANSSLLGCMQANHDCIDNIIHTKAGVQLRLDCAQIIKQQDRKEGIGKAKITPAYNLPCRYVLHTVGPQIRKYPVSQMNKELLARCYTSCLELAEQHGLQHIAFCCIATGVFGFPQEEACHIAIKTVSDYLTTHPSSIKVIFNVFTDKDAQLYTEVLQTHES